MNQRERLTTDRRKIFARESFTLMSMNKDELRQHYNEVFDRLQEYEVAEESGRIILPPCKMGDMVYRVLPQKPSLGISEYVVKGFHYGKFIDGLGHKRKNYLIVKHRTSCLLHHIPFDAIGKTIFFNKETAAAKLAEMK